MTDINKLITDNIDVWTSAIKKRNSQGRGSNNKVELVGVKKLRELILELAVRGKLVPQDPNDEPASVLLEKIAKEKAQLVKDKKIKKQKSLPEITDEEKSFELPQGWQWLRLTESYYPISPSGKKLKGKEIEETGMFPVVDQGQSFIAGYTNLENLLIKIPQAIIIFGDHTTNIKYVDFNFVAGADGTKILCPILLYPRYFYTYLLNYDLENRGYARHFKVLNDNLIAIPPLAEQHRIVAKVDELMALCDQLEQQTEQSLLAHQTLVEALLNALTQSVNADDFQESWQRIADHFDVLFTTETSIDQLKQTILQLAVMGKLVPQNPSDEPASKLLEKIAEEKSQLIKDKKIKKQKPLPEITDEEKPFEIPNSWKYIRLDEVSLNSEAGWSPSCLPTARENDRWGVLKVSAVTWGKFNPEENKELPSELEPRVQYEVQSGDFLISRANTAELVARAVVVPEGAPKKLMMSDKIIRFVFSELIDSHFINLVNSSSFARDHYASLAGGTSSSMKNVSREHIRSLVIALPPLDEQHSIIAKVDEFMFICERLKARIVDSQKTQAKLANAIVNGALI